MPKEPLIAQPTNAPAERDSKLENDVLRATERLLGHVSLHQLSVESILREAGTSRATFYRRFNSKWSVVAVALKRAVSECLAAAEPFFDSESDLDPRERLDRAVAANARVYREHRHILRAAIQYWPSTPELHEPWLHMHEELASATAKLIEDQRRQGLASPGPPAIDVARTLVWSATQCFVSASLVFGDSDDPEGCVAPAVGHLWASAIYGRLPDSRTCSVEAARKLTK